MIKMTGVMVLHPHRLFDGIFRLLILRYHLWREQNKTARDESPSIYLIMSHLIPLTLWGEEDADVFRNRTGNPSKSPGLLTTPSHQGIQFLTSHMELKQLPT